MNDKSDTIDLIKVLDTLIKNYKIIILILLSGLLIAFLVSNLRTITNNGSVEIFPPTEFQPSILSEYAFLHNRNVSLLNELTGLEEKTYAEVFESAILFDKFLKSFENLEIVRKNYLSVYDQTPDKNKSLASKYKINVKLIHDVRRHYLFFKSKNIEKDLEILKRSTDDINNQILNEMKVYSLDIVSSIDRYKELQIRDLEDELELLKNKYKNDLDRQKTFLREHKSIAESLGIDRIKKEYVSQIEESIFSKGYDGELVPYYLRGYEAIDREMKMLDERSIDKIELFDRDYSDVLLELQRVRQINPVRAERFDEIFKNISNFRAALIDFNQIKYSESLGNLYLYLIVLICSFAVAVIFVVTKESYINYKKNSSIT